MVNRESCPPKCPFEIYRHFVFWHFNGIIFIIIINPLSSTINKEEGDVVTIGLTDYAQSELGDLVFVNLPEEGDSVSVGEAFGDVESVKAVSDVYSPVSGVVCEINEELLDAPESINGAPYDAWFIKVKEVSEKEELLSPSEYEAFVASEQ